MEDAKGNKKTLVEFIEIKNCDVYNAKYTRWSDRKSHTAEGKISVLKIQQ